MRAYFGTLNQLLAIYRDASVNDKIVQPQEVITLIDLFGLLWCEVTAHGEDETLASDIALSLQYIGITSNDPMELAKHMRHVMAGLAPRFRQHGIDDADQLKLIANNTRKSKIGACAFGVMRCIELLYNNTSVDAFYDLRVSAFMPTLSAYLMVTREPFLTKVSN